MQKDYLKNLDFDFLEIQTMLSPAQADTMDTARHIAEKEIRPLIKNAYEEGDFPASIPRMLGEAKLLGGDLAGDHCHGYDAVQYGLIMRELERVDSGVRSFASVQSALAMYAIETFGSKEQKEQWLPSLLSGHSIGAFALTEPHGGSDPSNMQVTANYREGTWILNGHKRWVTNGPIADVCVVWASTDEGIRGFLVPLPNKKVIVTAIKQKYSMRVSHSSELIMDNLHLPKEALLPGTKGLGSALKSLNQARFGIIWGVLGAAEDCLAEVLDYAGDRLLFKRKLSSFQLVQGRLSDMFSEIVLAQLYAFRISQLKDAGRLQPAQVSLGKANHVKTALSVARTCRDILGGNGILSDYNCMRHLMNLETVSTYEGTHDVHRLVVGQYLTGESAFA